MVTLQERKKIKEDIEKRFGLADALPLFMLLKEPQLKAIQAGDFSSVPDAIKAAGLPWDGITGATGEKKKASKPAKSTEQNDGGQIERVQAETVPADFETDIKTAIDNQLYNFIELNVFDDSDDPPEKKFRRALKDNPKLWGAACLYIKENYSKKYKISNDLEYTRLHGTNRKDPRKVEQLLYIFEYYCNLYGVTPLLKDFADFAALSRQYLYGVNTIDGEKRELTSLEMDLLQKFKNLQGVSVSRSLADGRNVGASLIFFGKNYNGLKDEKTVEHISTAAALPVSDLPKLAELGIKDE